MWVYDYIYDVIYEEEEDGEEVSCLIGSAPDEPVSDIDGYMRMLVGLEVRGLSLWCFKCAVSFSTDFLSL